MNRLITISFSHYCEKARWALEHAGIDFREEHHLPGFHAAYVYFAARVDHAPVLITPTGVLDDSTKILAWADAHATTERKLFPPSPAARRETEELEDLLDEGLGRAGRIWMYTYMLDELPLLFAYGRKHPVPWHEKRLIPLLGPMLRRGITRWLRLKPQSRAQARDNVDRALDQIAEILRTRPYLTGDRFGVADLTFAALAVPAIIPDNYGVKLPSLDELPIEMAEQIRKWREHPGGQFALKMYRDHRGQTQRLT